MGLPPLTTGDLVTSRTDVEALPPGTIAHDKWGTPMVKSRVYHDLWQTPGVLGGYPSATIPTPLTIRWIPE